MAACKYWSHPGSMPHHGNNLSDEQLMALPESTIAQIIWDNFELQWQATGGRIKYLSPGDPGEWSGWIRIPAMHRVRQNLGLGPLKVEGYADMLKRPRSAKGITAAMIGSLGYARLYRIAYPLFKKFCEEKGEAAAHLKLRVGVASPLDWGMLVDSYAWDLDGFVDALANEITEILTFADPEDLLLSWESPFGQIFTAMLRPLGLGTMFAKYNANLLRKVLRAVDPVGKRLKVSLHPCWGDYKQNSMIEGLLTWAAEAVGKWFGSGRLLRKWAMWLAKKLQSPAAIAAFVNPLQGAAAGWLVEVLLCLAAGTAEPSHKAKDFKKLRRLRLVGGVAYIAGICHRTLNRDKAVKVARAAGDGGRITFAGYGSTCGLARTPLAEAEQVIDLGVHLCDVA